MFSLNAKIEELIKDEMKKQIQIELEKEKEKYLQEWKIEKEKLQTEIKELELIKTQLKTSLTDSDDKSSQLVTNKKTLWKCSIWNMQGGHFDDFEICESESKETVENYYDIKNYGAEVEPLIIISDNKINDYLKEHINTPKKDCHKRNCPYYHIDEDPNDDEKE